MFSLNDNLIAKGVAYGTKHTSQYIAYVYSLVRKYFSYSSKNHEWIGNTSKSIISIYFDAFSIGNACNSSNPVEVRGLNPVQSFSFEFSCTDKYFPKSFFFR
jgi:hypothetical protein